MRERRAKGKDLRASGVFDKFVSKFEFFLIPAKAGRPMKLSEAK